MADHPFLAGNNARQLMLIAQLCMEALYGEDAEAFRLYVNNQKRKLGPMFDRTMGQMHIVQQGLALNPLTNQYEFRPEYIQQFKEAEIVRNQVLTAIFNAARGQQQQ